MESESSISDQRFVAMSRCQRETAGIRVVSIVAGSLLPFSLDPARQGPPDCYAGWVRWSEMVYLSRFGRQRDAGPVDDTEGMGRTSRGGEKTDMVKGPMSQWQRVKRIAAAAAKAQPVLCE